MEATALQTPPILSTPDTRILEAPTPSAYDPNRLHSHEEIQNIYEVDRTVKELRAGKWKRIALQFPDSMLPDAPQVYEALEVGLKQDHLEPFEGGKIACEYDQVQDLSLEGDAAIETKESIFILADTSYGACCVDEIAAEHVDAEVVVHYGRACLSPTARLPVIHVFTIQPLDIGAVINAFETAYPEKGERIIVMSDVIFSNHLAEVDERLRNMGYAKTFTPGIVHNPSAPIPNRTSPDEVGQDFSKLTDWHLFHISSPPEALILTLSSRVASMRIFKPYAEQSSPSKSLVENASLSLRRRYALVTRLSTASIFGILINTLSVRNYLSMVSSIQRQILAAGKKPYTFVVGKVNAAKVANFSEVDGWVVVGCWESSLVENAEFWKPVITPFELEVALMGDKERVWSGEWRGDWTDRKSHEKELETITGTTEERAIETSDELESPKADECIESNEFSGELDSEEESEPPEFDLRTGRYIAHTRPLRKQTTPTTNGLDVRGHISNGQSLARRAKGDLAVIGSEISPAAEYLQQKRTWKGLGSDFVIAYDDSSNEPGTAIQEGRTGIARGYANVTASIKR